MEAHALLAALFAACVLICMGSGIWLILHLNAVTRLFRGKADLAPSPRPVRHSARKVWLILAVFLLGLAGTISLQIIANTGQLS